MEIDLATLLTTLMSSVGLSAATAAWLARAMVGHRLEKDLAVFKAALERERAEGQARLEGQVRQQVEAALGDLAVERQYAFDARKRLYTAIGPLRFQLLMACRDLAGRVQSEAKRGYNKSVGSYYGRSTLYRILRPLCLSELVERQIAYADFSVDTGAVDLLRFKKGAFAVFSGGSVVEGHPKVDWHNQTEHVFFDHLSCCANRLIAHENGEPERAMRFHEFEAVLRQPGAGDQFAPFPALLEGLTPSSKPLFWTRLVAYGCLCNHFVNKTGAAVGFETRVFPTAELLQATADPVICAELALYERRCQAVADGPL